MSMLMLKQMLLHKLLSGHVLVSSQIEAVNASFVIEYLLCFNNL